MALQFPAIAGYWEDLQSTAPPPGKKLRRRDVPLLPEQSGRKQGETGMDLAAPFKLPRLSTPEFEKQKAAYVAKNGYTISIPGLDDIIHLKTIAPMTPGEQLMWKAKEFDFFSIERYNELRNLKNKKRERYLNMLASPSPEVLRNAGAILTSIDNAQDALTTLSVIGRLAIKFAPRILGKAMLGPIGWILTASDVLNVVMTLGRIMTTPMQGKRTGEQATAGNPFSKAAQVKRAAKIMKPYPSISNLIEVAQTTDNVFGVGLCLGPIVGLLQDVMTGSIRSMLGQKVTVKNPIPHTSPALYAAASVPKATTLIFASGYQPDDELLLELASAHYLALQEINSNNEGWNALDAVPEVKTCQISVPVPKNILSLEVMEEEGHKEELFGGWPHHGKQWAVMDDIVNEYSTPGNSFLKAAMQAHEHDWLGHVLGNLLTESHTLAIGALEGNDNQTANYTEQAKFLNMTMLAGIYPDPNQPQEKLKQLTDLLEYNDFNGIHMDTNSYIQFMNQQNIRILKIGA